MQRPEGTTQSTSFRIPRNKGQIYWSQAALAIQTCLVNPHQTTGRSAGRQSGRKRTVNQDGTRAPAL
jgi:hypothetical protein